MQQSSNSSTTRTTRQPEPTPAGAAFPATVESRDPHELAPYRFRYVSIPEPSPEDQAQLEYRIAQHGGIDEPLVILPDNQIVDGCHRHQAALKLGLARVPVEVRSFPDPFAIEWYALQSAFVRRHLTPAQRFQLAEPLAEAESRHAQLRRQATLRQFDQLADTLPPDKAGKGKVMDRLASLIGMSTRQAERIKTVMEQSPQELFPKLVRGELRVGTAYRQVTAQRAPAAPKPAAPPAPAPTRAGRAPRTRQARGSTPPPRPRLSDATRDAFTRIRRQVEGWVQASGQWPRGEQRQFQASLRVLAQSLDQLIAMLTPAVRDVAPPEQ